MPLPPRQGLYDPSFERDACGLGFVATLDRRPSAAIVTQGLDVLKHLTHRGAAGCDPCTGDGAGILIQIPDALYRAELELPAPGDYAVATCFLPQAPARRRALEAILEAAVEHHRQQVLGWRDVPVELGVLGPIARDSAPVVRQLFIGRTCTPELFSPTLFMIRKRAGRHAQSPEFYVTSCSSKTVIYKGLMLAEQLGDFYKDLKDPRTVSLLALVHSRFSTNTFPTWELAHPFRRLAHNGEINALRGNRTWMAAREAQLSSELWEEHIKDFTPIIRPGGSDSAALDNVADFLVASGRSLPHVMMMLVPEAWADDPRMSPEKKAFYEYHGCLIEPWDGPAALAFTDGKLIGATLDRNGLRPAKYVVTKDGLVVLASEHGVLELAPERIVQKGRLQPGKMFLVDTEAGRIISDDEIKHQVARRQPYRLWLEHNKIDLSRLPDPPRVPREEDDEAELSRLHRLFAYTQEDLRLLLPALALGEEAVGSMGVDIPLAVLSENPQLLFRYFKQHFAQVTNPPIDPVRESIVMSLVSAVGGEGNLLEETPGQCRMLELPHPVLTNAELAKLRHNPIADFRTVTLDMRFGVFAPPGESLRAALDLLCERARAAVQDGVSIVILSDRGCDASHAAIPSLLAVSAVHHALMRDGSRVRCGLVVETAEAREVHHVALLVGYGAGAVNPYAALSTIAHAASAHGAPGAETKTPEQAVAYALKAYQKGLLKVMSKMGISTLSGYQGAQIFEAVGIDQRVVDAYFTGTASRLRGIGLEEIAVDALSRHADAYGQHQGRRLQAGGHYQFRQEGERHLWTPHSVASLQKAVRLSDQASYDAYAAAINDQRQHPSTLRGLWDLVPGQPVPLEEVEPAREIVKRFATGAMSFGSISKEAHENLALAMNRMGGRSNSGEGGEDPDRYGTERRSAIKQVASARFGVTVQYLVSADDLQIKIAQGAKPGEGGQLPGHKVDEVIARVRHATPGVTLISPPPHHDIYSIEDLAQLIFDLKCVNPRARISVKLVAEAGVGIIAAGVAKAHADVILISGHDGGTGASPLTSIHHAGLPWELGLAEAQQVLLLNGLRGRVRLQVDGQLKTGRDMVFGALLGAEEFGFSTAPLVASGCVMMRKCHLNTCPVGIATQDPELRRRFAGTPEHVINYFFFVAEEARQLMATLGFRTVDEMVGRVERIAVHKELGPRAKKLDFAEVLYRPRVDPKAPFHCVEGQDHNLDRVLDHELIARARPALEAREPVVLEVPVKNSDRALGAMLSGEVARRFGHEALPDDTVVIRAKGSAGQSCGAFLAGGVTLELAGDANDYVGKGLSGGILALSPPKGSPFWPHEQVIAGNTVLYGATSGKAFFSGQVGERFCVRNSGAHAVVEGLGDHGCEYMTGGVVVVLGPTGRNFGAGMSGGVAYVLDEQQALFGLVHPDVAQDLLPLETEDAVLLRALCEEHVRRTKSPRAKELLGRWDEVLQRFVKVLPREYRRAMEARAQAHAAESAASEARGGKKRRRLRVVHG